jgi:hypothetical protein
MMSFFPIPADKFGTKHKKKTPLTKENQQARKKAKTRRAHTIKDVRKQRQITDQYAANRITNIKFLTAKYDIKRDQLKRLAALATSEGIFDNAHEAYWFVNCFQDSIFLSI